ncbi:IclR family transcriptional regulator [Arthrobacter sp. StoSoilB22]|uniref:IclR family transcriptional regulator n=1 Tax=Arthrobacter sp. StoSoilB22 TaxID=2830996 RepID=UPI001CC6DAD6|nr:IclR family transcriptional regulator [Arthrobacter sp. StoSoilB22]BCW62895.1 IclR family transcriptional regulator [Arthrobacter sp. StoSoilB22]
MGEEKRLVGSDRVLAVLLELGKHPGGISLENLSRLIDSPKPTIHRALASLRRSGLAAQDSHGHYLLGDDFLRIAFTHHEARPDHVRAQPILQQLSDRFGETVHYAVLEGREVVYRSKVDPPSGAMKLTSVVGGRNPAHATGVGKVLLAYTLPDIDSITEWIGDRPLARPTRNTLVQPMELHAAFKQIREQGYAVDDQENEPGLNCIALPVHFASPTKPSGAISISALAHRTPLRHLVDDLDAIRAIVSGRPHAGTAA